MLPVWSSSVIASRTSVCLTRSPCTPRSTQYVVTPSSRPSSWRTRPSPSSDSRYENCPRGTDPDPRRSLQVRPGDVEKTLGVRDLVEASQELVALRQESLAHGKLPPARRLEELLVVVAQVDEGRGQHLVHARKRADDREQLLLRVVQVGLGEELHELLGPRERERDRERAAVRSADHDQPPAAPASARVVHRLPGVGEELDEAARDEPAHRVCDEVHRVAGAERLDLAVEPRGALVDVLSPVERERPHVPAGVELHEQRDVGLAVDPRRADVDAGAGGLAVGFQLEIADPAGDQADEVDPDAIGVALAVDGVELGAHDPGEDDDLAELSAAAPASRGAAGALERLLPHLLLEQALLLGVERDEDSASRVEVCAVERRLELLESRRLGAGHDLGPASRRSSVHRDAPADACDRCAAASAIGGDPATCPLSMVLPRHLPALVPLVKPWPPRRREAGRTPSRSPGSSPRGFRSAARRSNRGGFRAH